MLTKNLISLAGFNTIYFDNPVMAYYCEPPCKKDSIGLVDGRSGVR